MNILVVCAGAVCRSVAMALVLKQDGHDAIAISADWNYPDTFDMMSQWADRIVLMEPKFKGHIHSLYHDKIRVCDVGPDIWLNPLKDDLLQKCYNWVKDGGLN